MTLNAPLDQIAIETACQPEWDVAIIGAGPAGATAGLHLARKGRQVLMIDQHDFPRDKVCGDALIPDALHCLQRSGLYDIVDQQAFSVPTLRLFSPNRHMVDLPGEFKTIKRYHLDYLLVQGAVEAGAGICKAKVQNVTPKAHHAAEIELEKIDRPIKAKVIIIATGADISLLKSLDALSESKANATAMRCYVKSDIEIGQIIISFDRSIIPGYAWIFPMKDHEFNIGCGFFYGNKSPTKINLKCLFNNFMTNFPLAKELIERGEYISPLKGARLRCGLVGANTYVNENVLFIGETISTTFPFTGEGIGKAMETGELAANVIDKGMAEGDISGFTHFSHEVERQLKPKYMGYRIAENWLSRAWMNDFLIKRAIRSDYLRQAAVGIITETMDPKEIFSLKGLAKSLFH